MEQLQPVNYVMVSATTAETLSYAANFGTFSGPFTLEIKASYKQKTTDPARCAIQRMVFGFHSFLLL